jgi:hypothetical protein
MRLMLVFQRELVDEDYLLQEKKGLFADPLQSLRSIQTLINNVGEETSDVLEFLRTNCAEVKTLGGTDKAERCNSYT